MGTILIGLFIAVLLAAGISFVFQKYVLGALAGIATFFTFILFSSFTVISAGHTGVQVTFGEVNMTPLSEGVHLVNPLSSVKDVDVRL